MELTAEQFSKLSKLIYKKLGLQFDEKKLYFLNKRVERRITDLGLKDADEYLFQLGYCDSNGDEMQALANLVTTNETYMFREFEHPHLVRRLLLGRRGIHARHHCPRGISRFQELGRQDHRHRHR